MDRVYGPRGLHSTSVDPGGIDSGLQTHITGEIRAGWAENPMIQAHMKSLEQDAATTVYAATSADWEGKGGRFLQVCAEAPPISEGYSFTSGYADYAYDEEAETKFWEDSLKMVGLTS